MGRKTERMTGEAAHWRLAAGLAAGVATWAIAGLFGAPHGTHLLLGWAVDLSREAGRGGDPSCRRRARRRPAAGRVGQAWRAVRPA